MADGPCYLVELVESEIDDCEGTADGIGLVALLHIRDVFPDIFVGTLGDHVASGKGRKRIDRAREITADGFAQALMGAH